MSMFMGYGYGWMPMMWFGGLVCLVLLGLVVWALIRLLNARSSNQQLLSEASAMEMLRQRYARGEIDATTFEQMRERLSGYRQ